ncbi:oligosaccharide flippase family protein [Desulforhopalus vacuolatus]|uniref:oligosaccharide flippase family protein n=1 Tax=Desulforhopalus vacuolatus TaxID=40414 RepID=UPI0019649783|nr:oligosaccharide flippase family protein [Desulforhopalus vacuolatus]
MKKDVKAAIDQKNIKKDSMVHNSAAGLIATAIYLASRLLITPYVLTCLSLEEFGLWSICFVILSYVALGAFGVNTAYIRYCAQYLREGQHNKINSLFSTGIICMAVLCSLFVLVLYLLLPFLHQLFNIEPVLRPLASFMFIGTALIFCFDLTVGCFRSLLEGMQRLVIVNKITTLASFFEIAAILILLYMGVGLQGMLYAYVIRTLITTLLCMVVAFRLLPSLRLSPALFNREHFQQLFVYGGKMQVLGGIAMFLSSLDRMIISVVIGLSAAGLFEIGRKFPYTARSVSGAAFGAFLPRAAQLGGGWERDEIITPRKRALNYLEIILFAFFLSVVPLFFWCGLTAQQFTPSLAFILAVSAAGISLVFGIRIRNTSLLQDRINDPQMRTLYLQGIRHINILNFTLFLFLLPVAPVLIRAWVGEGYESGVPVMIFLALTYMIHQGTGPVGLIFRGIDRSGRELEYLLVQLVLVLAWLPVAALQYQLTGTVLAIMGSTLASSFFFFWRSNFVFQVGWGEFVRKTMVPGLVPAASALVVYLLLPLVPYNGRIADAVTVIASGVLYLGLTLPLLWKLVLTDDERETAMGLIPSFLRKTSAAS